MINLTNIDAVEVVNRINEVQADKKTSIRKVSKSSKFVGKNQDMGAKSMLLHLKSSLNRVSLVKKNLQNSLSFSQAQAGVLNEVGKILNRMSVLRTQAADVSKSTLDVENYNYEFKELQKQLCELKKANFNNVSLFKSVNSSELAGKGLELDDIFSKTTIDLSGEIKHSRAGLFEGMIPPYVSKQVFKSRNGGIEEDRFAVNDANNVGTLRLKFDAKDLKDNVRIYHNGMMIFDSGKVTGKHNFEIPYSGEEKDIEIVVNENNTGEIGAAQGAKLEGDSWFLTKPAFGADGTVYAGSYDQKLYAYKPDGTVDWSFVAEGSIVSSPQIGDDGTIYFGSGVRDGAPALMGFPVPVTSNTFYALNPDGSKKWEFKTLDGDANSKIYSTPALAQDGTIFFGSRAADSRVYALDQSGNLKWNIQKTGQEILSSPALSSDESTLYIGIGSQLVAFDAATGSENWSFNTGGPVYSSPSVSSDGNIYVGSFDGKLYSIDASGNLNWENEITEDPSAGGVFATPSFSLDEEIIYIGTYEGRHPGAGPEPSGSKPAKLYALDRQTGLINWEFQTQGGISSTAEIDKDGNIYVGSADTNLYSLSQDGSERWRFSTGGKVIGSPSIDSQGRVFVGSRSAALFMVENKESEWYYNIEYTYDKEAELCDDKFHLMDFEIKDFISIAEGWSQFVAQNGSEIQRIKSELSNLENQFLSFDNAVTNIQELDLAKEMAKLNKRDVLHQAAIKGLISIRSMPEEIMRILTVI